MTAMRWAPLVLAAVVLLGACTNGGPTHLLTASGVVISADGPNAAAVDRLTLRTDDGQLLRLTIGRLDLANGGLNAAHLREHLLNGEPITVYYYGDEVIRYVDAGP